MDQAVQVKTPMTIIIYLHVCLNIVFLGSGFQISCKKFGWTAWITAFMYFNLLDVFCNKVKLRYQKQYFVFWKHPGLDLEAAGGCQKKSLLGSGFQISCQKFSWTTWILLQEVQLPDLGANH